MIEPAAMHEREKIIREGQLIRDFEAAIQALYRSGMRSFEIEERCRQETIILDRKH